MQGLNGAPWGMGGRSAYGRGGAMSGSRGQTQTEGGALRAEGVPRAEGAPRAEGTPRAERALRADGAPRAEGVPRAEGAPRAEGVSRAEGNVRADGAPRGAGGRSDSGRNGRLLGGSQERRTRQRQMDGGAEKIAADAALDLRKSGKELLNGLGNVVNPVAAKTGETR